MPSTGARNSTLLNTQRDDRDDAVYNGWPIGLTSPPLSIYHPVFAKFQQQMAEPIDRATFTSTELRNAHQLILPLSSKVMMTTFPSLICPSKITKSNTMYPAAFKSPSKVGLTSRATVSNPIHLTYSSLIVGIFIMSYVFLRFLLHWPNSLGSTQHSKRVRIQGPYTHTTLQLPPEIKSAGDAQRPTKRIRIQEPNTPPTSTQLSSEK